MNVAISYATDQHTCSAHVNGHLGRAVPAGASSLAVLVVQTLDTHAPSATPGCDEWAGSAEPAPVTTCGRRIPLSCTRERSSDGSHSARARAFRRMGDDASAPELWAIPFSPWSLKTKWALHHCGLRYTVVKYVMPQSEWALRFKLRRWYVSAPTLIGKDLLLTDSTDIARYADARRPEGQGTLFCDGVQDIVERADVVAAQERCEVLSLAVCVLRWPPWWFRFRSCSACLMCSHAATMQQRVHTLCTTHANSRPLH